MRAPGKDAHDDALTQAIRPWPASHDSGKPRCDLPLPSDFSKMVIKMSAGNRLDARNGTCSATAVHSVAPRTSAVTEVAMFSLRRLAVGVLIVLCVAVGT